MDNGTSRTAELHQTFKLPRSFNMMAKAKEDQCILADVAADEAALDVQIEMALQRYQVLYNRVQMQEVSIAAKKRENELWDKLIQSKYSELDKVMKMREDVRKRTASLKVSAENGERLLKLLQEREAQIQEQRESIRARYQVLIDKTKAKISKYPLVVERDQLKNELLAAQVELGVLKYRNAEKKRQNQLMTEIREKQLNNAIVDLARVCINVKKLEGEKSTLLQELEEVENSSIQLKGQDETNAPETTAEDWTDKLPSDEAINQATGSSSANEQLAPSVRSVKSNAVDDILKNFHSKFVTRTLSDLPPWPVLSLGSRYDYVKPDQSAQVISASANEKSEASEKSVSEDEMSTTGTGEKCIRSKPEEMVPRRDESATNDSMADANVPLTSTSGSNSSEGKRAPPANAAQRGVKFMKTDDFIGARRLSERHQYPAASHAIDQGRGRQFIEHIAYHSGRRLVRNPPLQNIHSAARTRQEMEPTLAPEKTGSYPTAQENNNVPSTSFNERPNEKAGKNLPVPVQRYARGMDYGDDGANRALERDMGNRRANAEMVPGGKRSAEENFAACEQRGYVLEDELDFRSDNGEEFENYSDRNDEIDAGEEYAGAPMVSYDDGSRIHPSRVASKEKSSYGGIFPGLSSGEPPRSDHDLFGSPKQNSSSPHPFDIISRNSGDGSDRENFNFF